MKSRLPFLLSLALPLFAASGAELAPHVSAMEEGARWLLTQQQPDGSFASSPKGAGDVGITALAVTALAKTGQAKAPQVLKAVDFLLKNTHPDGSIWNDDGMGLYNYRTSVSLMALHAVDPEKHKDAIKKAQDYLLGIQRSEQTGVKQDDPNYGGIGYGSDPKVNDMSNLQIALQALKESGHTDSEVFRRAAEFAGKCQNLAGSNPLAKNPDAKVAVGTDGSFTYAPITGADSSKAGVESSDKPDGKPVPKGYGSMTYAGLLTMVYAHLSKEDPRVSAAMGWIKKHYSLKDNPGLASEQKPLAGKQGLYYYYLTFAKALAAYGEDEIKSEDGVTHRWARELMDILVKEQKREGGQAFWSNKDSERWMEGNPVLATSFALLALQICVEHGGDR